MNQDLHDASKEAALHHGMRIYYTTSSRITNGDDVDCAALRALDLVWGLGVEFGRGSSAVEPHENGSVAGSIPASGHPNHPARRAATAVDLTDDEIDDIWGATTLDVPPYIDFVRAVLAAQKSREG